jgi:hypothetical protein
MIPSIKVSLSETMTFTITYIRRPCTTMNRQFSFLFVELLVNEKEFEMTQYPSLRLLEQIHFKLQKYVVDFVVAFDKLPPAAFIFRKPRVSF